jgi:NAD(P)-dependent dehydrogenase (short-subunit alcohol dehydrogenase family)
MRVSAQSRRNDRSFDAIAVSLESVDLTGNTIVITGGGGGIGRALAEALHRAGNRVVIAGRRRDALRAVADANPGIDYRRLDLADPGSITRLAAELPERHPGLNVLVNNAGVMRTEDVLTDGAALAEIAETTVAVNLLGPMRLTAALLPTLLGQPHAAWQPSVETIKPVGSDTSGCRPRDTAATPSRAPTSAPCQN